MLPKHKTKSATIAVKGIEFKCTVGVLPSVLASKICERENVNKEEFLSTYIQEFPESAGFPDDFVVVDKEFVCHTKDRKPKRLDLLGYSEGKSLLYAVEVQAGQGDADHTTRTISYAKNVKQRLEEITKKYQDELGGANMSDKHVVGVLVCEQAPEECNVTIADDNDLIVVLVSFVKNGAEIATLQPKFAAGKAEMLTKAPAGNSRDLSLAWHKCRVENFYRDAKGESTFCREFEKTPKGCSISAPVRFTNGKKCTVGFWCEGGERRRGDNQVYLYDIPPEIFKAWDALGVNYRTGEQVVSLVAVKSSKNRGLIIRLDGENQTIWANHFADAVEWVNENRGGIS